MIRLTYIWHDCFLLETNEYNVIFDYWTEPEQGRLLSIVDKEKPLYVIVSHHHKDHFNKDIFLWSKLFRQIKYIISKDVYQSVRYILRDNSTYRGEYRIPTDLVSMLRPGDVYFSENLKIYVFGSTDIGNSYLLKVGEKYIFHAGDLNAWVWKDESTENEVEAAIRDFKSKIEKIGDITETIDLVMFPVDSRIGRDYWEGAKLFVNQFDVRHFVPMHFEWGTTQEESIKYRIDAIRFNSYAAKNAGEYHALQNPYESKLDINT